MQPNPPPISALLELWAFSGAVRDTKRPSKVCAFPVFAMYGSTAKLKGLELPARVVTLISVFATR